jgi:hypothetical protein
VYIYVHTHARTHTYIYVHIFAEIIHYIPPVRMGKRKINLKKLKSETVYFKLVRQTTCKSFRAYSVERRKRGGGITPSFTHQHILNTAKVKHKQTKCDSRTWTFFLSSHFLHTPQLLFNELLTMKFFFLNNVNVRFHILPI